MRIAMALLMAIPLAACEPESIMEQSDEALDDVRHEVTDTIEDAREGAEENIEQITD